MAPGYDALEPGYTGNENDPDHQHSPYVRHIHLAWHRDHFGQWVSESWDDSKWEVICRECGDTEGPGDEQSPGVRELRGPYSKHKAEHAATTMRGNGQRPGVGFLEAPFHSRVLPSEGHQDPSAACRVALPGPAATPSANGGSERY